VTVQIIEYERKLHHSVQATRLVHEHYATIMTFVCSQLPLQALVDRRFSGQWKYLRRALFEMPEHRAKRALIELGLYLRLIDDGEEFSEHHGDTPYGEIVNLDGSREVLRIREVANKIIHAARYEWTMSRPELKPPASDPTVVCHAGGDQAARGHKWSSASINLVSLGAFCGMLAS
jgi:hypothetical protein